MQTRFLRKYRISGGKQIEALSKAKLKKADRLLFVRLLENNLGYPRLAISVRRKDYPRAVDRNLIKRKIREKFRNNIQNLGSKDYMINVKQQKGGLDFARLDRSMEKLLGMQS